MKRVALVANTAWYFYNFRLEFLRFLRARGFELLLVAPEDQYSAKLRELGFSFRSLDLKRRSLNPLGEFLTLLDTYKIYREYKPDIVHHHTVKCVLYGTIAARLSGVHRVLNSVTGLGHLFLSDSIRIRVIRKCLLWVYRLFSRGKCFRFLFQNSDDLELFRRLGIVKAGSYVLIRGSGVDTKRFVPLYRQESECAPRLLFASRLLREKGIYELVEALRQLRRAGLRFEFRCAGTADEGNPSAIRREDLDSWEREGIVHFLGHLDSIDEEICAADIVLLPSWREGVPKILLEGASAGKALLATDVPGCREVVEHGKTGWLVPARNPEALAEGLRILISDPALRLRLGSAAREKVVREFDQDLIHQKTSEIYDELLSQV